jgi:DNA-binding response OmpR family regulator
MNVAKKIAILDDSPLVLEVSKRALERAGFVVTTASNLTELERLLLVTAPDLVLLDVNLPGASGDEVAVVLRKVRGMTAPILLFSNRLGPDLARRAAQAGASGYVSKEEGVDALVRRVRALVGRESHHD